MSIKKICLFGLTLASLLGLNHESTGALPADFPQLTILPNTNPAPGYLFGSVTVSNVPGKSNYFAILDNALNPILLSKTNSLGTLQCNGLFASPVGVKGAGFTYVLKDASFNMVATSQAGNGYMADNHDFEVLPNGHALILIYDTTPVVDMSQLVPGGFPAASPNQSVIQEVDVDGNVVFQWRSLDHIPVTDSYQTLTGQNIGDYIHVNSLWFDDTDGNIILSCRNTSEVIKISRVTGDILWRMQGKHNQFAFTNAIPGNTDPAYFQAQHNARRLPNGNITIYDNGYSQHSDPQYDFSRPYTRAVEYVVDEVNRTATLVWAFRHDPDIINYDGAMWQRLPGGHSIIQWGGYNGTYPWLAMSEADADGKLVADVVLETNVTGNFTRMAWPLESTYVNVTKRELYAGDTYVFNQGTTNVTGVTLDVATLDANLYNTLAVSRQPFAPVLPRFLTKAPRVVPVRVQMTQSSIHALTAVASFDVNSFGLKDPTNTTVYYRQTPGQGIFVALPTAYNWVTGQLQAEMNDLGEFIFGFPDLAEVPYPPLLAAPRTNAAVNQNLPVAFIWTPKGFAQEYYLQVSTEADFSTLLVDQPGLTQALYTNVSVAAGTRYYWRVQTWNDGGESDWATNSFTTVPPMVQVAVPNGGEVWQRGLRSIIQWKANLAENVALDLYKGGVLVKTITTNAANIPAYSWQVGTTLVPGNDYSIKIRSTTDPALFDFSDQPFSIDLVPVTVDTLPTALAVTVDGTDYTAPATFDWVAGSSHSLNTASPQVSGDGHTRYAFSSWSDTGAQSHDITTPDAGTTYTAGFSTQYRLDTAVTPPGAGTISNYPAGPWYDTGQLVSLTAKTNTGYRINFWQGVDSANTNAAQLTMSAYRSAQANFMLADYPYLIVTNNGAVAPGNIIGNIGGRNADGTKAYYVILDNTGTNIVYASKSNAISRFVTPQGFVVSNNAAAWRFKDETLTNVVDSSTTVGYTLDTHDVKLFPNGHSFVFGTEVRPFDMSKLVAGGKTVASVTGDIIQELDENKRVVFEWHTFDYIAITNTFADMTQASFDYAHVNAMSLDPTDNNLLASLRTTSEIVKINRQTGQVIWRLGGKKNMFTFIGEHPENAPYYTVGQHDIHRLANGNLLYFDNGNISGGGVTPNDRTYSRVVEYALDEVNMVATLVWEYRHTPDISASCTGSLKRFANGNTLIDWGCAVPTSGYIQTEVNQAGQIVFEMKHRTNNGIGSVTLGGGMTKQVWNSPDLIRSAIYPGIQLGQTYDALAAGVSVRVDGLSGTPDNTLVVQRHLDAVRLPKFTGQAPQVTMEHIVLYATNITTLEAQLDLSLPDTSYVFDTPAILDPSQVVVYQRATPGQGQFAALPTTYDAGTQKLRVTTAQLGEFIFGYPDVQEILTTPANLSPADQSEVNQSAPATLAWTVPGLFYGFQLQVGTNADFSNPVLDTNGLGSTSFVLSNVAANTQYYWRVRTVDQAGAASAWASASFVTVPPILQFTYPAGGEVWQRFQVVNITWIDNISDNVALDIYLDGVSNRTPVTSTASSGSYTWTVGQFQAFPFGTNYTMKIRSVSNPSLFAFSQPFAIITGLTKVTIATAPTNLTVAVDGTNYTAPAVFNWLPRSAHSIDTASPQVAGDGRSRSVFASWSDGGYQSHPMTVPFSALTNTASFFTNYLLDLTTTPADAGTVTANPTGPWYNPAQLVSLAANTNAGYLFYTWQSVESQMNNTAQITMNGYQAVQAKFIPASGVPVINTSSLVLLEAGGVRFNLTAGAGLATQATVWRATTLSPPDWQVLGIVPLTGGSGVFTDPDAAVSNRFYRVTLP